MSKGLRVFRVLGILIAIGVFAWYEYGLYKNYIRERAIREEIVAKNTQEIEKSFLIRRKGFYLDKEYIKKFRDMEQREKEEEDSLNGGEGIIEQTTGI